MSTPTPARRPESDDAGRPLSTPTRPPAPTPRRLRSLDLLGGHDLVEIEHEAQVYRLRRTALGKLILTK